MIDIPTPTALEVLTNAREMLADRFGKGDLKNYLTGNVCALGAIILSRFPEKDKGTNGLSLRYSDTEDENGAAEAVNALFDAIDPAQSFDKAALLKEEAWGGQITAADKHRTIYRFNDDYGKDAVLALFDRAIAALKAKEAQA